jgi:hypothetical protein
VDADGFWIASLLPQNLKNWKITKSSPTDRQAQVSFTLRHRLAGHTLEVEVKDTLTLANSRRRRAISVPSILASQRQR